MHYKQSSIITWILDFTHHPDRPLTQSRTQDSTARIDKRGQLGSASSAASAASPPGKWSLLPLHLLGRRYPRALIRAAKEMHPHGGQGSVTLERVILQAMNSGVHEIRVVKPVDGGRHLRGPRKSKSSHGEAAAVSARFLPRFPPA